MKHLINLIVEDTFIAVISMAVGLLLGVMHENRRTDRKPPPYAD